MRKRRVCEISARYVTNTCYNYVTMRNAKTEFLIMIFYLLFLEQMKRLIFEDLETWISVDENGLEQYGVHSDEGKREVTCWIASEVGKVRPYLGLGVHSSDHDFRNLLST